MPHFVKIDSIWSLRSFCCLDYQDSHPEILADNPPALYSQQLLCQIEFEESSC